MSSPTRSLAAPASRLLLLRRRAWISLDPIGARRRETRLGRRGLGGKRSSIIRVEPRLVVGDVEASKPSIPLVETNQQFARATPGRQRA